MDGAETMDVALDVQPLLSREKTGIGYAVENLLDQLLESSENRYELNFFALPNDNLAAELQDKYNTKAQLCRCPYVSGRAYKFMSTFAPLPYSLFFHNHAEVTHFQNFLVPPGVRGRVIATIHDMVYRACPETMASRTRNMMRLNMERSLKRADHIVTISAFSKNEILKYTKIPEKKITVIPCGVNSDFYHSEKDPGNIRTIHTQYNIPLNYILYMGTLEPRKNLPVLLDAYALALQTEKDLPFLVLAGSKGWGYREIMQKINLLNLSSKVIITGYISQQHKAALLSAAEFFVFPSIYEGFGLPPLEAMACGTPVVASAIPSCTEVLGDAALFASPNSTRELAEALLTMHRSNELRAKYAARGITQVRHFSWKAAALKMAELYHSLA